MMCNIPTNANCLIYNEFGTGTERKFIKHKINDIFWDETKKQNVIKMGVTSADSISMYIDLKSDYITSEKWKSLTIDEVMTFKYFTLQKGDVLIFGTPEAPNEFDSTVKISEFFKSGNFHIISSVDKKIDPLTRTIHHFEISGT